MLKSKAIYKRIFLLLVLSAFFIQAYGQKDSLALVQLSGIITNKQTGMPVPFSTAHIKGTYRGTIAGPDGFYSLVVKERDTIEYSSVGYRRKTFVVPLGVKENKLTHHESMIQDTITFEETVIYPWPSKEEFREAFLNLRVEDQDLYDLAAKNLSQEKMQELYETLAKDGREQQLYTLQQIAHSYYYAGGQTNYMFIGNGNVPIPASMLNPFAWVQFIQSIKNGGLKKKDK